MNKFIKTIAVVTSTCLLQACIIKNEIPASQIKATENSAFTEDGRFFVIGKNAQDESWIFEIKRNNDDSYQQIQYVKGTLGGTLNGELGGEPQGDDCMFGGLTAKGTTLYAVCNHIALYEVQTESGLERVKSGRFTEDNFIAKDEGDRFNPKLFFANGMAVDDAGHVYVGNSYALTILDPTVISQVSIVDNGHPSQLAFSHTPWIKAGEYGFDFFPNGIQIEDNILYYATQTQIRKIRIEADYSAGDMNIHYQGLMTDDFELHDGYVALASVSIPGTVQILPPVSFSRRARPLMTIPLGFIPSSVRYQQNFNNGVRVFPEDALIVTSFFNGAIHTITGY